MPERRPPPPPPPPGPPSSSKRGPPPPPPPPKDVWARELTSQFENLMQVKKQRFSSNRCSVLSNASGSSTSTSSSRRSDSSRFSTLSTSSSISLASTASAPPPYRPKVPIPPSDPQALAFQKLLHTLSLTPVRYENPGLLDQALEQVPVTQIYEEAEFESQIMAAQAESLGQEPEWKYQDCMVMALMRWFKKSFFEWVNRPICTSCYTETEPQGSTPPTPDEIARGASRTELFICPVPTCSQVERFPRYGDVWTLMQTRKGRCGEWANCFTMLCRAMGLRARWVWNSEDHVWTEVWSDHKQRWVHVDACEEAFDKPFLYTTGWNRRIAYCIAFSWDGGATDVTRRYVRERKAHGRHRDRCSEENLMYIIEEIREQRRSKLSERERERLAREDEAEEHQLKRLIGEFRQSRREEKRPRESGAPDWRRTRGEDAMLDEINEAI